MDGAISELLLGKAVASNSLCDYELVDKEKGFSGILWNTSRVLYKFILDTPTVKESFSGKQVLELGAGLGILGLAIAELGAHVTCTERKASMGALKSSVRSREHLLSKGSLRCLELTWGDVDHSELASDGETTYDYMIASELLYDEEVHEDLLQTMQQLYQRYPDMVTYFAFVDRPFSHMFFALLHDTQQFQVKLRKDVDTLGIEDLCFYEITTRKT